MNRRNFLNRLLGVSAVAAPITVASAEAWLAPNKPIVDEHGKLIKGSILHIEAGTEDWNPTTEELREISDLFREAEMDPQGAIIVTRNGIRARVVDTAQWGGRPIITARLIG